MGVNVNGLFMKWLGVLLIAACLLFSRVEGAIEKDPSYPVKASPQLPLEVYSEEFSEILGMRPKLVHLAEGFGFTEGPVYVQIKDREEGYFFFTDQINDNILMLRWHGLLPYGTITPLSWSKPVVYHHPSNFQMPNGIAFSPDEKILYVIDSGAIQAPRTYYENKHHAIYAYDVVDEGKNVSNQRLFTKVSPGFPDGMRLDSKGNIYVGALDGIQVFNPSGKLIGKILMPKETANLTFGGKDNNILFICSSNSVWAIKLNARGAKPVPVIDPMRLGDANNE
jgi:sugar lactone lactonase YvrE